MFFVIYKPHFFMLSFNNTVVLSLLSYQTSSYSCTVVHFFIYQLKKPKAFTNSSARPLHQSLPLLKMNAAQVHYIKFVFMTYR